MEAQRYHGASSESETDNGGSSSSDSFSEEETGRPSQSINEPHARWTSTYDITLANAMVQQILQGKTTKNGFSRKAWAVIRMDFNQKMGCYYTHQQIPNRKGVLKMQYKVVKQLLGHPRFNWDETRQMVIAEDAVWDDYLKHPSLEASTPDNTQQSAQEQADNDELAGALVAVQDKGSAYLARNPDIIQRCNKRQSLTPSGSNHRRRKESNSSGLAEAFFYFADALRCKAHASAPSGDPYAMSKCIKELESIKGVIDEDVFGAINVFRDPLLREAFLTMQPQRRLRWIRTQLNMVP